MLSSSRMFNDEKNISEKHASMKGLDKRCWIDFHYVGAITVS